MLNLADGIMLPSPKVFIMKKILPIIAILCSVNSFAQTPNYPFPHHTVYTTGSIKPNNYSQTGLDQQVKDYYDTWKARYIVQGCDASQYYIWYNDLGYDGNAICVSEGQGYGMVITAMMAGYDANAKQYFDGLYRWYKANPSTVNPVLMNWRQTKKNCASNGTDAATDGDEDIAFGLLLADKQWGSSGSIDYLSEARNIINAIMQSEVYNQSSFSLQLGDWAHTSAAYMNGTRPSDFMFDHLRCFTIATSDTRWNNVLKESYSLIKKMQQKFSPATGLIPDFIVSTDSVPTPAGANYLESDYDGDYYYNACRVPWRIACDFLLNGSTAAKKACDKINGWIINNTDNEPAKIRGGYFLSGKNIPGNNYQDLSFVAPFGPSAMTGSTNQKWLNSLWDNIKGVTDLNRDGYYGNTIKMMCMIIMSSNWWAPSQVAAAQISFNLGNVKQTLLQDVLITPNPSKGNFILQWNAAGNETMHLSIADNNGKKVYNRDAAIRTGINKIAVQLNNTTAGIYFLTLRTNEGSRKISILIEK